MAKTKNFTVHNNKVMMKRGFGRSSFVSVAAAATAGLLMTMLGFLCLPMAKVASFSPVPMSRHQHWGNWMTDSSSSSSTNNNRPLSSRLFYSDFGGDEEAFTNIVGSNDGRRRPTDGAWALYNDFDMFINQCSIQSFLGVLESQGDAQTALWVERFTRSMVTTTTTPSSQLLRYHGLGAMNTDLFPTWDSYFIKLLQEPPVVYEGMQRISIKPVSLCSRLLLTRQEIGAEFVKDLSVMAEMGSHTMQAYWDQSASTRNQQDDCDFTVRRDNLMFLDIPVDSTSGRDAPSPFRKRNFDLLLLLATQEAIHRVLNGNIGTSSSSSSSNDDKAKQQEDWTKLTRMQRRRQRRLNRHNQKNTLVSHFHASNMEFLKRFYMNRYQSHFASGSSQQQYGRADAFMAEILAELPTVIKLSIMENNGDDDDDDVSSDAAVVSSDDTTTATSINHLIDPTRIAQMILDTRREVALEWAQLARRVPDQHLEIKRLELNTLMKQGDFFGDSSSSGGVNAINTSSNVVGGGPTGGGPGMATEAGAGGSIDTTMESFEKALRAMTSNTDHDHHDPNPRILMVKNLSSSPPVAATNSNAGQIAAASASIQINKDISQ